MSAFPAIVGPIGPLELGIILLIVIVVFGPKRLPGIGRSLGEGMREFKDSVTGKSQDQEKLAEAETKTEEPVAAAPSEPTVGSGETDPFGRRA
jgi:sec-independent protein translocase protein TatA